MFYSHAPLNRRGYPCGDVICAHFVSNYHTKLGECIQRMPLAIKFSRCVFIEGQRAWHGVIRDPLPTEIIRSIEPDRQASVLVYKLAISFKRPRSAAERDYAGSLPIQSHLQRGCFGIAETRLSLLID